VTFWQNRHSQQRCWRFDRANRVDEAWGLWNRTANNEEQREDRYKAVADSRKRPRISTCPAGLVNGKRGKRGSGESADQRAKVYRGMQRICGQADDGLDLPRPGRPCHGAAKSSDVFLALSMPQKQEPSPGTQSLPHLIHDVEQDATQEQLAS
jgi:hypothetical protein